MQRGRVIHFATTTTEASAPAPSFPWFEPGWSTIHARHVAHWSGGGAWPSCRPESKRTALRIVEQQLGEYTKHLRNPVPGKGPPGSRVLLLLKSPSARQAKFPASVTTSSVYQQLVTGLLGSGAAIFVAYIFPFWKSKLWSDADIPVSAAEAFELYVKAVVRILAPKVVVCPGRYVAQYVRAACRAKNIANVPDTPINEFIGVTINRTATRLYRIIHPFQTSERCEGSSFQQRVECGKLLREGLGHIRQFVTVSRKPLDITALLMRGEKVPLGSSAAATAAALPGIDEPGHFVWVQEGRLATMDKPINKGQILHLSQHRKIRLVVNLTLRAHPKTWFRGIACRQLHCPVPDDGGVPSSADARRAITAVHETLNKGEAVVIHRTYGPGATGLVVRCLFPDGTLGLFDPTPVQREFLRCFAQGTSAAASRGTESVDPIVDDSPPRPSKRKRASDPHYVIWLIEDTGKHVMLERAFETQAEAETFVRRGNRALERSSGERARLRETAGLLGRPKNCTPSLYCLRSDDTDVYEVQNARGRVIRLCYGGKPTDDPSGAVKKRRRNGRENGRIDCEAWEQFSRGQSFRV